MLDLHDTPLRLATQIDDAVELLDQAEMALAAMPGGDDIVRRRGRIALHEALLALGAVAAELYRAGDPGFAGGRRRQVSAVGEGTTPPPNPEEQDDELFASDRREVPGVPGHGEVRGVVELGVQGL